MGLRRKISVIWIWVIALLISSSWVDGHILQQLRKQNMAVGDNVESDSSGDDSTGGLSSPQSMGDGEGPRLLESEANVQSNAQKESNEAQLEHAEFTRDKTPSSMIPNAENAKRHAEGNHLEGIEILLKRVTDHENLSSSNDQFFKEDSIATVSPLLLAESEQSSSFSSFEDVLDGHSIMGPKQLSVDPKPPVNSTLNSTLKVASMNITDFNGTRNLSNPISSTKLPSSLPNKTPVITLSSTVVQVLFSLLYLAGPSAGIFFVSPVYAIAARNLMDYFLGDPATVDLLHGAGILALVVDLTWGAIQ